MFDDETHSSPPGPDLDPRREGAGVTAPVKASRLSPGVAATVAALRAAVDDLAAVDLAELDGPAAAELGTELAAAASRLSAVGARALPVVEADGLWSTGSGAASFTRWVAARTGSGYAAAQAQVRLGRAMRDHLPMAAAAAAAGVITVEHAHVLARYAPTTDLRRAELADPGSDTNEAWLDRTSVV